MGLTRRLRAAWYRAHRTVAAALGFDVTHPASVQHWIETGRFLRPTDIC